MGGRSAGLLAMLRGRGHSHMSVDMKCLSTIHPLFYANLTPNDPPFSFSPHPVTPFSFFPLSYQILHTNSKFLHALHAFWEIYKFCGNFNIKLSNFDLKLHFCTLNDPHFCESTSKRSHFLEPTPNDPFFSTKPYTECRLLLLSGRHLSITFIFEWPPPPHYTTARMCGTEKCSKFWITC